MVCVFGWKQDHCRGLQHRQKDLKCTRGNGRTTECNTGKWI